MATGTITGNPVGENPLGITQNTAANPLGSNPNLNNISTGQNYNPGPTATASGNDTSITSAATPAAPPDPGGLQSPTPYSTGVDMTQAGAGENTGNAYLNYYAQNGTPTDTQNAQQAYQDFSASTPANMDPYYDNAQRLSDNAINTQMAARGSYGSSNAVGVLSNADTNLRAQQAKDEAQYGLSRAGLEGTLASGADQSSNAANTNEENWMNGLTGLGFQTQNANLNRGQQLFDNQFQADTTASNIQQQNGEQAMQNDQSLMLAMLQAGTAPTADQITAAQNTLSQDQAAANQTFSAASAATTGLGQYYKNQADQDAKDKAAQNSGGM